MTARSECPGCNQPALPSAGMPNAMRLCAFCGERYHASRTHEVIRLFEPAPEQLAGQLGFDDEPTS